MATNLSRPEYYINRELSWLDFNRRVLEEAQDDRNPLLERVKFLAIVANNLDEFFEVRVAGLLQVRESGGGPTGPDGLTPDEQLVAIARTAHELVDAQYACFNDDLIPALAQEKIHLWDVADLQGEHLAFVHRYWRGELEPILTPIVIDPAHPFPRVLNKALCIGVLLEQDGETIFGVVTVPRVLPRILQLPASDDGGEHMVTLAGIVKSHINDLFEGYTVTGHGAFRITRNSEMYVNEEEADNLLEEIEESLEKRRRGDVVRLEIDHTAPQRLVNFLCRQFEITQDQLYYAQGPVNLNRIFAVYSLAQRPELKDPPFTPVEVNLPLEADPFFETLRRRDVVLHHPYESFSTVIDFIDKAASDPRVLAIKQTLYRTGEDSQVIKALIEASDRGKEVTALIELKARFDEASNIEWAKQLEESGVHVMYGLLGMKTHCKLSMLVRRDEDRLRRYVHLGTGNYNHTTARLYTDIGLLTSREEITREVAEVFNLLTARSEETFRQLLVAPTTLMNGILRRIEQETENALAGRPAAIIAKMNGLTDPKVIKALYHASMAGVEIDLIVRGVCCLRPGLLGISERIRVYSIIGRFLEHSRLYYFANDGTPELWAGSADWMNRNLRNRVEVVFPIEDPPIKRQLMQFLQLCLADRVKTRACQADGSYVRLESKDGESAFSMQDVLMAIAHGDAAPGDLPDLIGWTADDTKTDQKRD